LKRIRLLVDGHWFDHPYESTAVFLKGLYTELALDEELEIFIAAYDVENLRQEFNSSSRIDYLKLNSSSKYYRLLFDFPKIIRKNNIDVAHYQYISPLRKTTKEIVTIHDLLYRDFPAYFPLTYKLRNNFFFGRSAKRADLITSVSSYSMQSIRKYFNIELGKMRLIPNGILEDYFIEPAFLDVRKKYNLRDYVLCVSRIEPRKNHLFLVKAYCELVLWERNVQLVFVGRQDIKVKELDTYLDALPHSIRKNIILLENVPQADLKNLYRQAEVVVYPSLGEGFGIPPLEAAALKANVLCSNTTAMSDFTFLNESLFDPYDLETFKAKLLNELKLNIESVKALRVSEIRSRYNWNSIAKTFAGELKKLF